MEFRALSGEEGKEKESLGPSKTGSVVGRKEDQVQETKGAQTEIAPKAKSGGKVRVIHDKNVFACRSVPYPPSTREHSMISISICPFCVDYNRALTVLYRPPV